MKYHTLQFYHRLKPSTPDQRPHVIRRWRTRPISIKWSSFSSRIWILYTRKKTNIQYKVNFKRNLFSLVETPRPDPFYFPLSPVITKSTSRVNYPVNKSRCTYITNPLLINKSTTKYDLGTDRRVHIFQGIRGFPFWDVLHKFEVSQPIVD